VEQSQIQAASRTLEVAQLTDRQQKQFVNTVELQLEQQLIDMMNTTEQMLLEVKT